MFKYKIGDVFVNNQFGDTIEITGFNYLSRTYKGNIKMKFKKTTKTVKKEIIFESDLNKMAQVLPNGKGVSLKKDKLINYRVYYFEEGQGNRSIQSDVSLTNIRALAKYLNSMLRINPNRRVIMVAILDDNGIYLEQVKFLKKEFKEQKFLTGMKERLLAHAKYECGYEVATSF
jgi:hypothetical protein